MRRRLVSSRRLRHWPLTFGWDLFAPPKVKVGRRPFELAAKRVMPRLPKNGANLPDVDTARILEF